MPVIPGPGLVAPRNEQPVRVLLVDDSATVRAATGGLLVRLGYEVDSVSDGQAALDAASARPYDAILMDLQMPRMDGLEATRRLQLQIQLGERADEHPAGVAPRVIALTASSAPEDRAACLALGMVDLVAKPTQAADLLRALGRPGLEPPR